MSSDRASDLAAVAQTLVAEGKGILAADESDGTIKKRFDSIGVESTEDRRRAYRELLFATEGAEEYISGVILFDETIRQSAADGTPFPKLLADRGVIPGIKVDKGAKPLALAPGETVTEGLDGLRARLDEYRGLGARFAKWRATYTIGAGTPSEYCVWVNAHALARYAALCQEAGIVPIVEPEVLMDGDHDIETAAKVTGRVLQAVYTELHDQRVALEGTLLKPNMVLSGYGAAERADVDDRRGAHAARPLPPRARGGARHRLPVRRAERRGRDRAPQRHERPRPAPVAAVVLVRPRPAGPRAQGVARRRRQRAGRPAGLLPPRGHELRRADRRVHAGAGARRVAETSPHPG